MADEQEFDWDDGNISHLARHNVSPGEAEQAITAYDPPFGIQRLYLKGEPI